MACELDLNQVNKQVSNLFTYLGSFVDPSFNRYPVHP